jgi:molecular chaperone HtpG
LLRFASTETQTSSEAGTKDVSLDAYLERKIEGQDKIYYLAADSYENAKNSPHLEVFKERGIEVLLLFDRIDEWLMSQLTEYAETGFQDVMRSDLALPGGADEEEDEEADSADEHEALTERIKAVLDERVQSVRPSKRLTDSPACLVLDEFAMGAQMRQIMEASGQSMPETKPHFEYNANHPLLEKLDTEPNEARFADLVWILFDQASLAEGGALADSSAYVGRLNRLLLELLNA